ncbi:short-chain dehydrogenase [Pandoraea vervacti]|uniref:Short-chain dehydrogenase n=2 Tax=Pandoraea TaxID=93217 RepID=A0A5E5AA83_9BURK|nr:MULTISPECIES: SDR family oxidoreductase [Pandoraea]AJP56818.1 short-chain dehydrogenase [Pandoraea vervacti]VVE70007.1 short-chain dehydrogenase [Pandoraea captiosa]
MLLNNKVVVISGIGPGLGIKLAIEAAREGAAGVVLAARSAEKLDAAERRIREAGSDVAILKVPTDITQREQCRNLVSKTVDRFGRIDSLVNSAYNPGNVMGSLESSGTEGWDAIFETNVFGTMNLALEASVPMSQQKSGAMVMINSLVTRKPLVGQAGYAISKGALGVAVKYLAKELGPKGIRVNSVSMGWMWGSPVEGYMRAVEAERHISVEDQVAQVAANIPLGRIPTDDDCAKAALFLVSDYANAVTGAWLDANGGEFMAA